MESDSSPPSRMEPIPNVSLSEGCGAALRALEDVDGAESPESYANGERFELAATDEPVRKGPEVWPKPPLDVPASPESWPIVTCAHEQLARAMMAIGVQRFFFNTVGKLDWFMVQTLKCSIEGFRSNSLSKSARHCNIFFHALLECHADIPLLSVQAPARGCA